MPLRDHTRSPLREMTRWGSFHANWSTRIADQLMERLSHEFRADQHFWGEDAEIDITSYPSADQADAPTMIGGIDPNWKPPPAEATIPSFFPPQYEIQVRHGWKLVGAIELVTFRNKRGPRERRAFASRCASYLYQGVSLIVIDIVTALPNVHDDIMGLIQVGTDLPRSDLHAVAYRPVIREKRAMVDLWTGTVAVGHPLPVLPLRLIGDDFVPVDLESAYEEACRRRRLA